MSSETSNENLPYDQDTRRTSKCATCLICSILNTLTSYNCCSTHLAALIGQKNSRSIQLKQAKTTDAWPPQHVMIVPVTDELLQRYLDPQQVHRLRTQGSSPPTKKPTHEQDRLTRTLSRRAMMASDLSDPDPSSTSKPKTSTKLSGIDLEVSDHISISSVIDESGTATQPAGAPADTTYTVVPSTSSTVNSFESPTILNTCQIQRSSDVASASDDTQPVPVQPAQRSTELWTPISDETYAAMEIALTRLDDASEDQHEFTPAAARRTPTELMASCLPKIQLRQGRFRQGRPIAGKDTSDAPTESHSPTLSQSSSSSSTSVSIIVINTRTGPSPLPTIAEDESFIVQPTRQTPETLAPPPVLAERHDNISEGLSDTVMSCLFAQDEASQHDYIASLTKLISSQSTDPSSVPPRETTSSTDGIRVPPRPPAITIDDCSNQNEIDVSQSSQLTNDQNETQHGMPSSNAEKGTPVRITYRTNPDGSRVSISRPSLSSNHPSPSVGSRRASTDVASVTASRQTK